MSKKILKNLKDKISNPDVTILHELMKNNKCKICKIKCENSRLNCGDIICEDCVKNLHQINCPFCNKELIGGKMTSEIKNNILEKIEEINSYKKKILELNENYNINSLANKDIKMYKIAYYNLSGFNF